ncbi:MAG TPA: methylated-DNA--[protein]-cysteine S-methyltransferase [Solirubrobacteraceae bacterium]
MSVEGRKAGPSIERALRSGDPAGPGTDAASRAQAREDAALAAARLAARAAADGLADIAYAQLDSPLGTLTVLKTKRGLVRLAFPEEPLEGVLERIATRISPRIVEAPAQLDLVRRELEEYFAGERRRFELALDWSLTGGFTRRVLRATAAIPYGGVLSYGQVAGNAGSPRGSRAAGNALGSNPLPIVVPCHRVLRSGGVLGGYGGGPERKRWLLELEGAAGA